MKGSRKSMKKTQGIKLPFILIQISSVNRIKARLVQEKWQKLNFTELTSWSWDALADTCSEMSVNIEPF